MTQRRPLVVVNGQVNELPDGDTLPPRVSTLITYDYDSRGSLRSTAGTYAVVEGLGLFQFVAGSDEPDDDESCFATSTGRWLLAAVHWDVVDVWNPPDDDARDAWEEDEAARTAARVLHGTATCAITSVAATTSVTFAGTVAGAAVGDRVLATPPDSLGATSAGTARLSFHAYVSAANCHDPCGSPWMMEDTGGVRASTGRGRSIL